MHDTPISSVGWLVGCTQSFYSNNSNQGVSQLDCTWLVNVIITMAGIGAGGSLSFTSFQHPL